MSEQTATRQRQPSHDLSGMEQRNRQTPSHPVRKSPFIFLAIFLTMWFVGVAAGEPGRVLEQAWHVCLSCIGLG